MDSEGCAHAAFEVGEEGEAIGMEERKVLIGKRASWRLMSSSAWEGSVGIWEGAPMGESGGDRGRRERSPSQRHLPINRNYHQSSPVLYISDRLGYRALGRSKLHERKKFELVYRCESRCRVNSRVTTVFLTDLSVHLAIKRPLERPTATSVQN